MADNPTLRVQSIANFGNVRYNRNDDIEYVNSTGSNPAVDVAKTGTVTVRTTTSIGTLTLQAGHGLIAGDRFDMFWTDADGAHQSRLNVLAGVVVGTSVPVTSGEGDNLPNVATAITVMKPLSYSFGEIDGDRISAILAAGPDAQSALGTNQGVIRCMSTNGHELFRFEPNDVNGQAYIWHSASGADNPLTSDGTGTAISDYPVSVTFSHSDSDASHRMGFNLLFI